MKEENFVTFDYLKSQLFYFCELLVEEKNKEPMDLNEIVFLSQQTRTHLEILAEKLNENNEGPWRGDVLTPEECNIYSNARWFSDPKIYDKIYEEFGDDIFF